jgi:hypothetical protein
MSAAGTARRSARPAGAGSGALVAAVWTACTAAAAPASPAGEPVDAYAPYLPPAQRAAVVQRLAEIPWRRPAPAGAVVFVSGESRSPDGRPVRNAVRFFPGPRLDVWTMRQQVVGEPRVSELAIVVDTGVVPPVAYYLEFAADSLADGRAPRPRPFSAACFTCHASGPRALRPLRSPLAALDRAARARIAGWNQHITGYGAVRTHRPDRSRRGIPPLDRADAAAREALSHRACVGCHSWDSGVRAPLLRQHARAIESLVRHGPDREGRYGATGAGPAFMPARAAPLTASEWRCLQAWLADHRGAGCTPAGERAAD